MKNKKQTSKELGSEAGKALRTPNSSKIKKVLQQTSYLKQMQNDSFKRNKQQTHNTWIC